MRFDRKQLFDGVRTFLKVQGLLLTQKRTDALDFLISSFEATKWTIPQISYALATIFHETAHTFEPIYEYGPKSYFNKYEPGTRIGRNLGNTQQGDGYRYRGAGYVQITGRSNYRKFGIENTPDYALRPAVAFGILRDGMRLGLFTSKKLSDYISDTGKDYKNARRIINGTDRAALIAGYANQFETILRDSKTSAAPPTKDSKQSNSVKPADQQPKSSEEFTEGQRPASLIPVPTEVIEVEAVVAAPTEPTDPPKEDIVARFSNRLLALPAAVLAAIGAAATWATSAPANIVVAIVVAGSAIVVIYFIINSIRNSGKEKRAAAVRLEQERRDTELKIMREKHAQEIQMLTLRAAADPSMNNVRVVQPPPATEIPNSDVPQDEINISEGQ